MKFIPSDNPTQDEIDSIKIGNEQLINGEYLKASEIDWDNFDSIEI